MKKYYSIIIILIIVILISILVINSNKENINDFTPMVKFSLDKKEILEGNSELLSTIKANVKNPLTFISSNSNVVLVNETGIIKAISPGEATVTVIYEDEKNRVSDSILIVVKSKYDSSLFSVTHEFVSEMSEWNAKNIIVKAVVNNNNENTNIDIVKYSINCPSENCDSNVLTDNYEFMVNQDGKNSILIEAIDTMGTVVSDSFEVFIDKSNPIINYNIESGKFYEYKNIIISVSDLLSGVKSYDINVYKNGIRNSNMSKNNISGNSPSYSINLNSDATWRIETIVTDNVGNVTKNEKNYVIDVMGYREGPGGARYKKTITYKNRTYKVYNQHAYTDVEFWGGNLSTRGCGPTSLAIVLSGYNSSITPVTTAKLMGYGTFSQIQYALKQLGYSDEGIIYYNSNYPNESQFQSTLKQVRAHLAKGYPLIALVTHYSENDSRYKSCGGPHKYATTNHFMAILGEKSNGELVLGNSSSGAQTGTLEEIVRCYLGGGRLGFLKINPTKR